MAKGSLTIYYYSDPQHGWYRVKESWFKKYGIDATKISNCSYGGNYMGGVGAHPGLYRCTGRCNQTH